MNKTEIAVSVFDKHAVRYMEKYMEQPIYYPGFDLFCQSLPAKPANVVELGCGPGNVTKYMLSRIPDANILGTDLAPNMLKLARQNNPAATFRLMDARAVATLNQKFDGIIAGFVIPYLTDVEVNRLIGDSAGLLNDGGVLYLSTMKGAYKDSGIQESSSGDQVFIHYYEPAFLIAAIEKAGLTLVLNDEIPFPDKEQPTGTDLVMIAVKERGHLQ